MLLAKRRCVSHEVFLFQRAMCDGESVDEGC